ncbi:uncharacterized protein [Littorina saxatilis]|uniref:uncharacterized protein n=1 Tax=Littorina saxatilis TaxID=31220 RepID=UPI0038B5E89C
MLAPVRNMHKDYVVRYTSKGEAGEQRRAQRPCTAPSPRTPRTVKRIGCRSAGAPRNYVEEDLEGEEDNDNAQGRDFSKTMDSEAQGESSYRPTSFPDPMGKYAKDGFRETDFGGGQGQTGTDTARSAAGSSSLANSGRIGGEEDISAAAALASSAAAGSSTRPNRSKMVEVGLMGTIELLESIQEHDAEDGLSEVSTYSSSSLTEHERRLLQRNSARKVRLQLEDPAPLSTAVGQGNHAKPLLDDGERKSKIDLQATQQDTRSKDNKLSNEKGINAGRTYDKAEPTTGKLPPASHLGKNIGPATTDLKTSTRLGQPTPETMFPLLAAMQNHSSSSQARVIVEKPEDTIGDRQRAESVASSTITDTSDEREVPTPLTSITVTIKNRDQHVTSSTRRADDVDHTTNNDDNGAQSPSSFRSSRPCVTSTPRQRKPLSNTRTTVGNTSRPGSGNRERTKSAADLPTSNTDSRVQDQILAMNSAYETREDEKTKECGPTRQEDGDQEDVDTILAGNEGRKKSIHFCPDTRESNAQLILKRLSSTERLLRPKKFDLNAEAPRRYIFNKATTRRLLERVHGVISPEMRSRIKKGDTGLKVI